MYEFKTYKEFKYNDDLSFDLCGDNFENFLVLNYKGNITKIRSPERLLNSVKHYSMNGNAVREIYHELTSELCRRLVDFKTKELNDFCEFIIKEYIKFYPDMYK